MDSSSNHGGNDAKEVYYIMVSDFTENREEMTYLRKGEVIR